MIAERDLANLMAGIEPIGWDPATGTTRLAWTPEDRAAAAWFAEQAHATGRRVQRDPAGNLWACPEAPEPWWAVGSHLDSVRGGGRFDGALGVAAAFAVAARARSPLAVISFADEEGARFNTPTFGSRALVGALDVDDVLARVDERGVTLPAAMSQAGVDPAKLGQAVEWLSRLRGFLELHVDQSRDVASAGAPAGVVDRLAARLRLQLELGGRADHAGTTPRSERSDALTTMARVIVAADDEAAARDGMVFTAGRIEVEPNAPTTVPGRARLWLDARGSSPDAVESWHAVLAERAGELAKRGRVHLDLHKASWSSGTDFPVEVTDALAAALPADAPRVVCFAGHDAGAIARARPSGMILVRNERGVSHAPDEHVSLADAAVAATALLRAADDLASRSTR